MWLLYEVHRYCMRLFYVCWFLCEQIGNDSVNIELLEVIRHVVQSNCSTKYVPI